jgi:hypothetical protein
MAMNLTVHWHKPVALKAGKDWLIYDCDLDAIPEAPGVYVFGRLFGADLGPVYIGRADNIRKRVEQHLHGNVKLMNVLKAHTKNGNRVVVAGEWLSSPGQQQNRALPVIEAALIKHALAEGYSIFNNKGAKEPAHTINRSGFKMGGFLPKLIKSAAG